MVMGSLERLDPPRPFGKMTLLAHLGEGGMATVYLASVGPGKLARLAAVKLLRQGVPDNDYRGRFLDEAKLVVRLHHNNLVDVREAGEVDGQLYITMELVEGRDLSDVWDRCARLGRALPVSLAVHIVREILRGLHYAHSFPQLGLVHRDVSPSNILIDWAGAVRLADFGLATSTLKASSTVPGVVFGKVGYMSPEQALRRPLDARADVYGCAVVLWELLTGRPMRPSSCRTEDVAEFEAAPASQISRRIDPQLDEILSKALARDRRQRFEHAGAFMEALGGWLVEHAPQTNQETVAKFMSELFGNAAAHERRVHAQLLEELTAREQTAAVPASAQPTQELPLDGAAKRLVPSRDELPEVLPGGTMIAGRYTIETRLGRGGMGTVYLAEHVTVGRRVAIKVLTEAWSRNQAVATRFRAEARAASAAGHPNIVEVFDAGRLPDGRLYLVMEYLIGRTLHEELRELGTIEYERACRIVREVARAVRAAHQVGIIHRDLKPDNVMLVERDGDTDAIKVLDFGISAELGRASGSERLTVPGHAIGTPEYMAPEQARGQNPSERFDIYALGVMLYELVLGTPPFSADTYVEVMARKVMEAAPSLGDTPLEFPPALVRLVDECLALEPNDRPHGVDEVIDRLDAILRAEVQASFTQLGADTRSHASMFGVASRSGAKRWLPAFALAAVGAAAATILVVTWQAPQREQPLASVPTITVEATPVPPDPETKPRAAPAAIIAEPRGGQRQVPPDVLEDDDAALELPRWKTTACERTRMAAVEARTSGAWESVLKHVRARSCWEDPVEALRLKVVALRELNRFHDCVAAAEGSRDALVKRDRSLCQRRLERR